MSIFHLWKKSDEEEKMPIMDFVASYIYNQKNFL